jgi:tight adherence protein B
MIPARRLVQMAKPVGDDVGALIGLVAGVGLLLVWSGLASRQPGTPRSHPGGRTRERLAQAGLTGVNPTQLMLLQGLSTLVVLGIVIVLTNSLAVAGVFAAFAAALPRLMVSRLRNRRQAELREVWPEVVDNLTSGVRAGLSLPEALSAVGNRGPDAIRSPFRQFGADYRATGKFNESIDRLKETLADPTGDRVCESLRVAREVGGTDLGRLLSTLSGFLRDDARTRGELMARQSWSVNAARTAVCAPWLVLLLLATQQQTLTAYDSATGVIILAAGAGVSVFAYRLMMRIGRLPEDRRVLR